MRPNALTSAVVAVALVGSLPAATEELAFGVELNRAREAMEIAPFKTFYDGPFNKAFYAKFSGWLNQCSAKTGQALENLDLILTLAGDGKVQTVRFEPQSANGRCFAELVRKESFPSPPSSGLAVPVSIRMTKPKQ